MYIHIKDMAVNRVWSGVQLLKLSSVLSFEANVLALALVSHYVFIYHFTGLEVHFPGYCTPPSLRQRLGLPPLCAFSRWFYDRSARVNSFFTYVKYITLHYLLYGYKRHIITVSTNISVMTNNEKAKVMRSTQWLRDCTIRDEAQLVAASPRESPLFEKHMISRYILIFI